MDEENKIAQTPLMKQYFSVKAQHPDALLLFRVGDFYETFGEDARIASKVLGIVLTKRANGYASSVDLAGFPHHAIDTYLPKLVRGGYKVAVCDQLEDPKLTKKIVKRGVTELVTPGIAYNEQLLTQKENNFLAAVNFSGKKAGVAFLDVSTGTFEVGEGSIDYVEMLLSNFSPKEIVLQREYVKGFRERFGNSFYLSVMDEWAFVESACEEKLKKQFRLSSLKGFGVQKFPLGVTAAGAVLFYLEQIQKFNNVQEQMGIDYRKMLEGMLNSGRKNFVGIDDAVVGYAAIALAAMAVVPISREIVYRVYNTRKNISNALELQAQFLEMNKASVEHNENLSPDKRAKVVQRQANLANKFRQIASKLRVDTETGIKTGNAKLKKDNGSFDLKTTTADAESSAIRLL